MYAEEYLADDAAAPEDYYDTANISVDESSYMDKETKKQMKTMEQFWIEDISVLFQSCNLIPTKYQSLEELMNTLTRITIIVFLILFLCRFRYDFIFLCVVLIILILFYYIFSHFFYRTKRSV